MNEIEVTLSQTTNEIGVDIGSGNPPILYVEKQLNQNKTLIQGTKMIDLGGTEDLGTYCLGHAYYFSGISGDIDMSSLKRLSGNYCCSNMFNSCQGITSVDLSGVEVISGIGALDYFCFGCGNLKTINFNKLTTITASGQGSFNSSFRNTAIEEINFPALTTIERTNTSIFTTAFYGCQQLKTVNFPKLETIGFSLAASYGQMFAECINLEHIYFNALKSSSFSGYTSQFSYIFNANTGKNAPNGCTVHFPSNFDPENPNHTFDASTLYNYPTFGGNANYIHVAFDLPATE